MTTTTAELELEELLRRDVVPDVAVTLAPPFPRFSYVAAGRLDVFDDPPRFRVIIFSLEGRAGPNEHRAILAHEAGHIRQNLEGVARKTEADAVRRGFDLAVKWGVREEYLVLNHAIGVVDAQPAMLKVVEQLRELP